MIQSRASSCLAPRIFCRHSHIGSKAIQIPQEPAIDLVLSKSSLQQSTSNPVLRNGSLLRVTGPAGICSVPVPGFLKLTEDTANRQLKLSILDKDDKIQRSMWGLTRSLIANAVNGATRGHTNTIQLVGVGYRMSLENTPTRHLSLKLGYSTPITEPIPANVDVKIISPTECHMTGPDKAELGQFCSRIRRHRPPEAYNSKGVFVNGETIKRKEVKKK